MSFTSWSVFFNTYCGWYFVVGFRIFVVLCYFLFVRHFDVLIFLAWYGLSKWCCLCEWTTLLCPKILRYLCVNCQFWDWSHIYFKFFECLSGPYEVKVCFLFTSLQTLLFWNVWWKIQSHDLYDGTLKKDVSFKYIGGKTIYWSCDLDKWS